MTTLMMINQHEVWGQTPPKEGGYVTAQRLNAASVADIDKRHHASKQRKNLARSQRSWIKAPFLVDRFLFLFSPQIRYSR